MRFGTESSPATVDDKELTTEDRWHTYWWDWAPLKLSLSLISAVLGAVILFLPELRGGYRVTRTLRQGSAVLSRPGNAGRWGPVINWCSLVADAIYFETHHPQCPEKRERNSSNDFSSSAAVGDLDPSPYLVKPQNRQNPLQSCKFSWRTSSTPTAILDIEIRKAPATARGFLNDRQRKEMSISRLVSVF